MSDVSAFALSSGMAPAQLSGTAKICLSVGYRTDDMDVALASALLLTALGEAVYGELIGHHLALGFGAAALIWRWTGIRPGFDAVGAGPRRYSHPASPSATN